MLLLKCNWLCHSQWRSHWRACKRLFPTIQFHTLPRSQTTQNFDWNSSSHRRTRTFELGRGGAVTSLPEKHYITPENASVFKRTQIAGKTKNVHNSHVQWNCDHFKIDILKLSIFYDLDWQHGILGQKVRENFKKAHCGTIQNTELFFGRATTKSSGLRLLWFFFLLLLLMQIISWISTVRTWNHIWHNIT